MDAFHLNVAAQEIIFGLGALDSLSEAVERAGWQRLLLCTTANAHARGHVMPIAHAHGKRLVGTFASVRPHVPEAVVARATAMAAKLHTDAVIGLGGGSAIGTAKAICHALAQQRVGEPAPAIIAIPTTYAGSEMTPVFGVTHHEKGTSRKITVSDPRITPRLVIYDPLLTLDLPPHLTASTGINALAHCIEALYSVTRNPLASAAALAGVRAIAEALPRCHSDGTDRAARRQMQEGAFLAGTALAHVAMGLHHGICHVLGGTAGVAHGDANAAMLPHVMRFNLEATAAQLAPLAAALDCAVAGQTAAQATLTATQRIATLIGALGLPQRLSDLGIAEQQLPELAQLAFEGKTVHNNPRPIGDVAQIEALLLAAW